MIRNHAYGDGDVRSDICVIMVVLDNKFTSLVLHCAKVDLVDNKLTPSVRTLHNGVI